LRKLLNVASGGVVFTTLQKLMPEEKGGKAPELSKRRNIIVIAGEAHRSQYDLIDRLRMGGITDSFPRGWDRKTSGAEIPFRSIGPGEMVALDEVKDKALGEVLSAVAVVAACADKDINGSPVNFAEAAELFVGLARTRRFSEREKQ
jgi:hypothetical protein